MREKERDHVHISHISKLIMGCIRKHDQMPILEHEETHQIFSIFLKQLVKRENKIKREVLLTSIGNGKKNQGTR